MLSVIVPVLDAMPYLPKLLDGVLAAGIEDMEILLIDDGSTDGSLELCRSYAAARPEIRLLCQHRQGPSLARDWGMDESRGELIAFLDADDEIDPQAFAQAVAMAEESGAQILATDFYRIAGNGCILDRVCQIRPEDGLVTDPGYLEYFLASGERVWNVWRYIFRRSFLLEKGLSFIPGVDCAEDLEFMVRALAAVERPAFHHRPYYYYRAHYGDTLTRRYTAARVEQLMAMLRLSAEHLEGREDLPARLLMDMLVREYLLNLALCCQVPGGERRRAYRACQEMRPILSRASGRGLRAVSYGVRLLGVRPSAWLLYCMKKIKRRIRAGKIRRYGKRTEEGLHHGGTKRV